MSFIEAIIGWTDLRTLFTLIFFLYYKCSTLGKKVKFFPNVRNVLEFHYFLTP